MIVTKHDLLRRKNRERCRINLEQNIFNSYEIIDIDRYKRNKGKREKGKVKKFNFLTLCYT